MTKRLSVTFALFLSLVSLAPLLGQEASAYPLYQEITHRQLRFTWDPYLELGILERDGRMLRFHTDAEQVLVDQTLLYRGKVKRGEGEALFVDRPFLDLLEELFPVIESSSSIKVKKIIIDPGHGGRDPGAVGRHRIDDEPYVLYEKDVVLDVSRQLHQKIRQNYPAIETIMTRGDDRFITLEERTEIANKTEIGDLDVVLFISIHANASLNSRSTGFEVWYLPPEYRRELIDPESLDPELRDVAPILNTMLEEEYTTESILLAQMISLEMENKVGHQSINRGLKEESWFVVRNAKMPSVLVELGFVTNLEEALLLGDQEYLMKLTEGIYNGVVRFISRFDQ